MSSVLGYSPSSGTIERCWQLLDCSSTNNVSAFLATLHFVDAETMKVIWKATKYAKRGQFALYSFKLLHSLQNQGEPQNGEDRLLRIAGHVSFCQRLLMCAV